MTSGITNKPGYARITLTVEADDRILDQIQKQIYKLIDVVKVKVFEDHDVVCRELMLIKVKATAATRSQIVQIADVYRGNVLDISPTSMIIEVIGSVEKLRGFIQIMETYGVLEIAKTGITANEPWRKDLGDGCVSSELLHYEDVKFRRDGREILKGINWHVEEGENWALLGLNGAGKSTMLSMIPAYQIPTTGLLRVFGHEFGKYAWPKIKARLGLC